MAFFKTERRIPCKGPADKTKYSHMQLSESYVLRHAVKAEDKRPKGVDRNHHQAKQNKPPKGTSAANYFSRYWLDLFLKDYLLFCGLGAHDVDLDRVQVFFFFFTFYLFIYIFTTRTVKAPLGERIKL